MKLCKVVFVAVPRKIVRGETFEMEVLEDRVRIYYCHLEDEHVDHGVDHRGYVLRRGERLIVQWPLK